MSSATSSKEGTAWAPAQAGPAPGLEGALSLTVCSKPVVQLFIDKLKTEASQ